MWTALRAGLFPCRHQRSSSPTSADATSCKGYVQHLRFLKHGTDLHTRGGSHALMKRFCYFTLVISIAFMGSARSPLIASSGGLYTNMGTSVLTAAFKQQTSQTKKSRIPQVRTYSRVRYDVRTAHENVGLAELLLCVGSATCNRLSALQLEDMDMPPC